MAHVTRAERDRIVRRLDSLRWEARPPLTPARVASVRRRFALVSSAVDGARRRAGPGPPGAGITGAEAARRMADVEESLARIRVMVDGLVPDAPPGARGTAAGGGGGRGGPGRMVSRRGSRHRPPRMTAG